MRSCINFLRNLSIYKYFCYLSKILRQNKIANIIKKDLFSFIYFNLSTFFYSLNFQLKIESY